MKAISRLVSGQARQIMAWGALWGIVVTVAERSADTPPWSQSLQYSVSLVAWCFGCCVVGSLHLVIARLAILRGNWRALVLGWLLVSVCWAVASQWLPQWTAVMMSTSRDWEEPATFGELLVNGLWANLFFGGILIATYTTALRTERTRSLLQDAAIARSRTSALRSQVDLANLQRHVDPVLLLEVMSDVEQHYRMVPERADDLLGRLVDFLRCALPGLKDPVSTLDAELQLARAYVSLQSVRQGGIGVARWTVDCPEVLPTARFPSQIVLPLLALAAPRATPRLRVRCDGNAVKVEIHDLGRAVSDAVALQARSRLQLQFGAAFTLETGALSNPQWSLTLGLASPTGGCHGT